MPVTIISNGDYFANSICYLQGPHWLGKSAKVRELRRTEKVSEFLWEMTCIIQLVRLLLGVNREVVVMRRNVPNSVR